MRLPDHWKPYRVQAVEYGGVQVVNAAGAFICWCDNREVADAICEALNRS